MSSKSLIHRITGLALSGVLALLCSCGSGVAEPEPGPPDKDAVYIRFTMVTRQRPESRAADISGEQPGFEYENMVNIADTRYLVYDADGRFLCSLDDAQTRPLASDNTYTLYDVTAKLDNEYFRNSTDGSIAFSIAAYVNTEGWNLTLPNPEVGDPIDNLFGNGVMQTVPVTADLMQNKLYFPMAGLQNFSVPATLLALTAIGGWNNALDISAGGKDLNLLRALAKIEIIDKINVGGTYNAETDSAGDNLQFRIRSARIHGYFTSGTLFPWKNQWERNSVFETQQVFDPTLPASPVYNTAGSVAFAYDAQATALRTDKCPVFSGYLFEYALQDTAPQFSVNVNGKDYTVKMAEYVNGVPVENIAALLRNHIYRFEVSAIGASLSLNWTVCPMDKASVDITFN